MTRDGKTYYYQTNYRGDVLALTDSSGNVVATYEYDAFGRLLKETGTVENPYRYAGYRYDKETGLYYLQSRYYNPEMGRFLTRDVFEGFLNETLSVNKYVYTENNPVMSIDPDGYWKKTIYLSKKTMWKILATGAGIGVVLAAAGGWWVLAAAILGYIVAYGGYAWIGKKGTKIVVSVTKRRGWIRPWGGGKRYRKGTYYRFRFYIRRW
jgi:RHS repeat-associated protein